MKKTQQPGEKGKVENLLKPRYWVIADWPGSRYCVGDVLYLNKDGYYSFDPLMTGDSMKTYPHLFKLLQWWEERIPEEMPEYVKGITVPASNVNAEPKESVLPYSKETFIFSSLENWIPATETEYNNYLKQNQ